MHTFLAEDLCSHSRVTAPTAVDYVEPDTVSHAQRQWDGPPGRERLEMPGSTPKE